MTARRRILGIDLGAAASATTAAAVLDVEGSAAMLSDVATLPRASSPAIAEDRLWKLVATHGPDVVALDAPLTLPPCLRCSAACTGPGVGCELREAREFWAEGGNPLAQRPCEKHVLDEVGVRPLPTMQLGTITARAVAFARRLARLRPEVVLLEVYPRATLMRLALRTPALAPRRRNEPLEDARRRVASALAVHVDGLPAALGPHELDAIVAAVTGALHPGGLVSPPPEWPDGSGWIAYPR